MKMPSGADEAVPAEWARPPRSRPGSALAQARTRRYSASCCLEQLRGRAATRPRRARSLALQHLAARPCAIATSEPWRSRSPGVRLPLPPARRRLWRTGFRSVNSVRTAAGPGGSAPAPTASCRVSSASSQHSAVSIASAGRQTSRFGHGPQARQVLDRLVGRAVLAEADRIVGHDVDDALRISAERRIAGRQ